MMSVGFARRKLSNTRTRARVGRPERQLEKQSRKSRWLTAGSAEVLSQVCAGVRARWRNRVWGSFVTSMRTRAKELPPPSKKRASMTANDSVHARVSLRSLSGMRTGQEMTGVTRACAYRSAVDKCEHSRTRARRSICTKIVRNSDRSAFLEPIKRGPSH